MLLFYYPSNSKSHLVDGMTSIPSTISIQVISQILKKHGFCWFCLFYNLDLDSYSSSIQTLHLFSCYQLHIKQGFYQHYLPFISENNLAECHVRRVGELTYLLPHLFSFRLGQSTCPRIFHNCLHQHNGRMVQEQLKTGCLKLACHPSKSKST